MGETRSIATACQAYATDYRHYPDTGGPHLWVTGSQLSSIVAPDYIQRVPATDPWGHPYWYAVSEDKQSFAVMSAGSDGIVQTSRVSFGPVNTECFEADIIWFNDAFYQKPEGRQRACSPNGSGEAAQGFPAVAGKIFP